MLLAHRFNEKSNKLIASKQAAYLKNRFPFFGLIATERREIQKKVFKKTLIQSENDLIDIVLSLYNEKKRELHYAAIDLSQKHRNLITRLDFIEKLITTHSWWDSVDLIASNVLGFFLKRNPEHLKEMDFWIQDENLWKRRSALIFQLKWKGKTDVERLLRYCQKCALEREFFIEKAIGWALREFSKTNPSIVKHFIKENEKALSSFTKKEACKLIM